MSAITHETVQAMEDSGEICDAEDQYCFRKAADEDLSTFAKELFDCGMDTLAIGQLVLLPEAKIYNALHLSAPPKPGEARA